MKIFLDANVFVAASGNESGGSHYLFRVARHDSSWQLLTSAYALEEARLNILKKLPLAGEIFSALITAPELTIVHPPSPLFAAQVRGIVPLKDEAILAAALFAQADFLCTLDQRDFHTTQAKHFCQRYGLKIVKPQDLLRQWRQWQ
ncbi:MAG: hypothetical protein HYV42_00500 [Candidatus Magasanikbacteria bacterium]|nr:hypothetical protein [Candidatus Magasanikbacteria bacterium]